MGTTHALPLLERVEIAAPCPARWEDMEGDEKRRLCAECNLHVHNLSALTREEAEALVLGAAEGRVCVQLYKRADGTVITQDCPVGLAAIRARMRRVSRRIAAALGLMMTGVATAASASREAPEGPVRLRALRPFAMFAEWLAPSPPAMPTAVRPLPRGVFVTAGMVAPIQPAPAQGTNQTGTKAQAPQCDTQD